MLWMLVFSLFVVVYCAEKHRCCTSVGDANSPREHRAIHDDSWVGTRGGDGEAAYWQSVASHGKTGRPGSGIFEPG